MGLQAGEGECIICAGVIDIADEYYEFRRHEKAGVGHFQAHGVCLRGFKSPVVRLSGSVPGSLQDVFPGEDLDKLLGVGRDLPDTERLCAIAFVALRNQQDLCQTLTTIAAIAADGKGRSEPLNGASAKQILGEIHSLALRAVISGLERGAAHLDEHGLGDSVRRAVEEIKNLEDKEGQ